LTKLSPSVRGPVFGDTVIHFLSCDEHQKF